LRKTPIFCQKLAKIAGNCDHNIGFLRKTPIFCQKLAKIAENCDHNIDPSLGKISPFGRNCFPTHCPSFSLFKHHIIKAPHCFLSDR
jgi:hypothetical protein